MRQQEREARVVDSRSLTRRWVTYVVGIYILTLGLSLAIRAGIGISPQSSLTRTMTLVIPGVSQGTFNFTLEVIMLSLTFFVMPKAFRLKNFLGLIPALILATLLDFNLMLTGQIVIEAYVAKLALLIFADASLAFGLFLMIRANLVLMPIDMFVNTIYKRTGRKWGNIKTVFDRPSGIPRTLSDRRRSTPSLGRCSARAPTEVCSSRRALSPSAPARPSGTSGRLS